MMIVFTQNRADSTGGQLPARANAFRGTEEKVDVKEPWRR